jgi:hypothetical protein
LVEQDVMTAFEIGLSPQPSVTMADTALASAPEQNRQPNTNGG